MNSRHAIALIITVFFIMLITVALGVSLKQVKEARDEIHKQDFILQTNIILEDVLKILNDSKELEAIAKEESGDALNIFLAGASFIPFEHSGISVILELKSARSMFNINAMVDKNGKLSENRVGSLVEYFRSYNVDTNYVGVLQDNISKSKVDTYYNSEIFTENPYLFRDYIASKKHLQTINDFFMRYNNDNSLSKIKFDELFYFSKDTETKIDLNYATPETWRLLLHCDEVRAEDLSFGGGSYQTMADLNLTTEETEFLSYFETSFYEPFLDVRVEIKEGSLSSKIRFEYDMKTKKGSNFVYEI
jgi:hypothetical protein